MSCAISVKGVCRENEETSEDDDEAMCVIIRRTKQKKHKHRLDAAVGRPESEWSFIGEGVCREHEGRHNSGGVLAVRRGGSAAYGHTEAMYHRYDILVRP
ncbi:hypothetical protein GUJ93_ZPchr0001g29713 [Zizania palustris]|uniref:Uncharacterized protein n=1 Tax=Zizania palustris TaxID=103762 RepID=A0A8J5SBY4_ZIZPA|nr:hypothetical protein GUJ93_ZPchr0001g29713 [Zizania palustris]